MKGQIVYSVLCACGYSVMVSARNRKKTAAVARDEGWKLTRKYGWTCPRCIERAKKGSSCFDDSACH